MIMWRGYLQELKKHPARMQFIWLVYLAFPIYAFINQPVHEMWIGFALLAVVVFAYLRGFLDAARRQFYLIVMLVIIGFFCLRYSPYFLFMGFYCTPLIGTMPTPRQFWGSLAAQLALFTVVYSWYWHQLHTDDWVNQLPSLAMMVLIPFAVRAGVRSKELRKRLNVANEEIARLVQNEERERISRDLHDTLGHTLSLISLKSELAEKLIAKHPERAVQEVKDIQTTARTALKQVRELVSGMHAVTLRDEIRHAGQILAAADMELETSGPFEQMKASPLVQNLLGLCLREAVTNVVKHSKATRCRIALAEEAGLLSLTVEDNGRGFDESACDAGSTGRGLLGMKERLGLVEGKLSFQARAGEGARLTLSVPSVIKQTGRGGA